MSHGEGRWVSDGQAAAWLMMREVGEETITWQAARGRRDGAFIMRTFPSIILSPPACAHVSL